MGSEQAIARLFVAIKAKLNNNRQRMARSPFKGQNNTVPKFNNPEASRDRMVARLNRKCVEEGHPGRLLSGDRIRVHE
jgi:hypothetical protein